MIDYYWDLPTKRFDDNSKLIVVEGNIGSGKSSLAKQLADQLGQSSLTFLWIRS